LLLALLAVPVWESLDQWHFGQGYDDSVYFVTAKALATGHGYRVLSLPGEPYAVKYPPIYPLFLSLAWRIQPEFPQNLRVAAVMQALLLPVFVALLLGTLRRMGLSWRRIFLSAALTLVTLQMAMMSITLFSELLFLCLLLLAMQVIEKASVNDDRWLAMAAGALTGLAYLTRSAALPMLVAAPVFYVLRKRGRLIPYFLAAAVPMAALWHAWTFLHGGSGADPANGTYLNEYAKIIHVTGFWSNFLRQLSALSGSVAENIWPGILQGTAGLPLFHIALAAAIMGAVRIGRREQWPVYVIFSGFYLAMIVFWWFDGLARLTVPVWPMLVAGIGEEMSHLAAIAEKDLSGRRWQTVPRWALIALGLYMIFRTDRVTTEKIFAMVHREQKMREQDVPAFSWIVAHKEQGTVLAAWKDATAYLYTGAPASRGLFVGLSPLGEDSEASATPLSALPEQYQRGLLVLLRSDLGDALDGTRLSPFRNAAESLRSAQLEFDSPGASVYRFSR